VVFSDYFCECPPFLVVFLFSFLWCILRTSLSRMMCLDSNSNPLYTSLEVQIGELNWFGGLGGDGCNDSGGRCSDS